MPPAQRLRRWRCDGARSQDLCLCRSGLLELWPWAILHTIYRASIVWWATEFVNTRSNVHIRHVRMKGVFLSPHSRCVPARSITNPAWNIHPQHSFDHTDRAVFAVGKKRKSCVLVGVWWEESLAPARFIDCALFADNAIAGASTHSSRVRLTPCPLPIRHPLVMPPTTAAAAGWRAVVVPSETAIIIDGRNQRDVG